MGRFYVVNFEDVAVSAAQDIFEITPVANRPVELVALHLLQTSDLGDAAEEILQLEIVRGHATSGSGGSAATPVPLDAFEATVGFAAEVNNTTIASAGTPVILQHLGWNVRVPGDWVWIPEARPRCSATGVRVVVRLDAAPADALTVTGSLVVHEF